MKRLSFAKIASALTALALCATGTAAEPIAQWPTKSPFTIKIKLTHNKENYKTLFFPNAEGASPITAGAALENGYQVFRGSIDGIATANLIVRGSPNAMLMTGDGGMFPGPALTLVVRNGAHIVVEGDADKPYMATVTSDDREARAYETFRSRDKAWMDQEWTWLKELQAKHRSGEFKESEISASGISKAEIEKKRTAWQKEFVKKYPDTYAAIEVFAMYALELTDDEQAAQFAALPATYKTTSLGKTIATKIAGATAAAIGKPLIPFAQKGSDGKVVDIAAMKGKVILIDFWGSWCVPCRATHPHLKGLYSKYKDKGFEIVAVATESGSKAAQKKAWKDAIKKDGITWPQVLNDPEVTNINKMYGVVVYPTKVLVDRNGVIQGRFTGDTADKFDSLLKKLLAEPH